jgi:hypothetical protein
MTRDQFIKMIQELGYVPSESFKSLHHKYSVWEHPDSNVLLQVKYTTFDRVYRFENGDLAIVESPRFSQHKTLC